MAVPTLLFLVASLTAVVLCLWSWITALLRVADHPRGHRWGTAVGSALLMVGTLAAGMAVPFGLTGLYWAALVLPPAICLVTWSNVMTLRDQHWSLKLAHLPTFCCNCLLLGIYTTRLLLDFTGIDLGTWANALTAVHVHLQTHVGHASATAQPVWTHMAFCLPLCLRYRTPQTIGLLASSAVSTYLLVVLASGMAAAYDQTREFRNEERFNLVDQARQHEVSIKVPWGKQQLSETERQAIRDHLLELRVAAVSIDIDAQTFEDRSLFEQVRDEMQWARQHNLSCIHVTTPPLHFRLVPASSLDELRREMAQAQWQSAKRLQPDLLVLFTGPFGSLQEILGTKPSLDDWCRTIDRCATDVREANDKVRLAVTVDSPAPHGGELFRLLKADDSPVDVVGISLIADPLNFARADRRIRVMSSWCERSPGTRPVWILATGCSPYSCGGELGQKIYLARVLELAHKHGLPMVSVNSLIDLDGGAGLLSWSGRRRPAYRLVQTPQGKATAPKPVVPKPVVPEPVVPEPVVPEPVVPEPVVPEPQPGK